MFHLESKSLDWVRAISPYLPGKPIAELAREFGLKSEEIVKLASNENPLGPSASSLEAIRKAALEIHRYPDANGYELKQAIAEKYRVQPEAIVLGNGSNDILELISLAFLAPGRSAVYSQFSFAVYPLSTQARGAEGICVKAKDYGHDLPAMWAAIRQDTRVVFVANPNNPTGTFAGAAELRALLEEVPRDVLVVLDEAYTEYLPTALRYSSIDWLSEYPNLIIVRTFSKAYGLAGLRVGFGLMAPAVAELLNRVRQPFNVSHLAQAAAVAALQDEDYLARSYRINQEGLSQLTNGLQRLAVPFIPSLGNFLLMQAGEAPDAGGQVNLALLKQGVIVRPVVNYGLPQHLRVSVGLPEENQRFLMALENGLR